MNYKKIYDALIQHRKTNKLTKSPTCYCESHHITPKCMNGKDKPENLINLTAREHYIAHLLLWKHYKDINPYFSPALLRAITCMMRASKCTKGRNFKFNSRLYENIKQQMTVVRRNSIMITNGSEQKWHDKRLPIPDGWYKGTLSHNFKNTRMITNRIENKRISKTEEIPLGYYSGTTIRCKRICITDGNKNRYIDSNSPIPNGWHRGSYVKPGLNKMVINNGIETRYIEKDQQIPTGWKLGNASTKDKYWITDGKHNLFIDSSKNIPDGWHIGMTMKQYNRKGRRRIKNEKTQEQTLLKAGESLSKQQILDGWEYGTLKKYTVKMSLSLKANKNRKVSNNFVRAQVGKIWVNDGKISIRVYPDQIPNGYVKGRLTPWRSRKVNN